MKKPMTHAGKVNTNGRDPHWISMRETPKFWTDGYNRWKKLQPDGTPDMNPVGGSTWHLVMLDVATIRPLTIKEHLAPLENDVHEAASWQRQCADNLLRAQRHLDEAQADVEAAAKRSKAAVDVLAKFRKKHELD